MYALLYLKWITNKDIQYVLGRTWNSVQCYVAAWIGGEFGGERIHVYVQLSVFTFALKRLQNCLLISHSPVQNENSKRQSRHAKQEKVRCTKEEPVRRNKLRKDREDRMSRK